MSVSPMSAELVDHVQVLPVLQLCIIVHELPVEGPFIQNWYERVSPSGSVAEAVHVIEVLAVCGSGLSGVNVGLTGG